MLKRDDFSGLNSKFCDNSEFFDKVKGLPKSNPIPSQTTLVVLECYQKIGNANLGGCHKEIVVCKEG